VERHVVVKTLARQLLDALGMLGRDIGAQFYNDAALVVSMTMAFCLSRLAGSD
jgi:hypothetical protein